MSLERPYRPLTVGTKRTEQRAPGDYRVVCVTCGAGGTVQHSSRQAAAHAAIRDSARPCRACGAS